MSFFDLLSGNFTLKDLAERYPHLRRYLHLGFEIDVKHHRDNEVGISNRVQALRVNLSSGWVHSV